MKGVVVIWIVELRGSRAFFKSEHIKMLEDADLDYYKQPRPQLNEDKHENMERQDYYRIS